MVLSGSTAYYDVNLDILETAKFADKSIGPGTHGELVC